MRRRVMVGLVGVVLSVALSSEALAAPNASVSDKVKAGEYIRIEVQQCYHGQDYTAYVDITVLRGDGTVADEFSAPADPSFNTLLVAAPDIGSYTVRVKCRHQFDATRSGTFWEETEPVVVTGLTSDEKKKCKKKRTARARRRCLKRERAD